MESARHLKLIAKSVMAALKKYQESERVAVLSSFFKSGKGQYGEGDIFLGITNFSELRLFLFLATPPGWSIRIFAFVVPTKLAAPKVNTIF